MLLTKAEAKEAKEFIEKHRESLNKKPRENAGLKEIKKENQDAK